MTCTYRFTMVHYMSVTVGADVMAGGECATMEPVGQDGESPPTQRGGSVLRHRPAPVCDAVASTASGNGIGSSGCGHPSRSVCPRS